jgi:hypothetical protein
MPISQTAHVVFRGITHDKRKELEKVVGRIDAKVYTKAKQQVPAVAAMLFFNILKDPSQITWHPRKPPNNRRIPRTP